MGLFNFFKKTKKEINQKHDKTPNYREEKSAEDYKNDCLEYEKFSEIYDKELFETVELETSKYESESEITVAINKYKNDFFLFGFNEKRNINSDINYHKIGKILAHLEIKLSKIEFEKKRKLDKKEEIIFFKSNPTNKQKLEWIILNINQFKNKNIDYIISRNDLNQDEKDELNLLIDNNSFDDLRYKELDNKLWDYNLRYVKLGDSEETIEDVIESYKDELIKINESEIENALIQNIIQILKKFNSAIDFNNLVKIIESLDDKGRLSIKNRLNRNFEELPNWILELFENKVNASFTSELKFSIKGIHILENKINLDKCNILDVLCLYEEPENEFDSNAIVIKNGINKIGYIPVDKTQLVKTIIFEENYLAILTKKSTNNFISAELTILI